MRDSTLIRGEQSAIGQLSQYAISCPIAFDTLAQCMNIQPDFDRDAGSGSVYPVEVFLGMKLELEQVSELMVRVNGDPYKLYTVLRAYSYNYWPAKNDADEFKNWLADGSLRINELLTHIRAFIPDFGVARFGGNDANTEEAGGKRTANSKP